MFELTPEQRDIKQAAREFAEGEFREVARELDRREEFDEGILRKAGELGLWAPGAVPHRRGVRSR